VQQTATTAEVVHREIRIDAAPSTVFEFLTDPAKMVRWMGTEAVLGPRPGGDYAVNINGHERVSGEVTEIIPHRKLVFTWGWEGGALPVAPGESTVEISLEPDGDGTLLRLTHRDLPQDMRAFHRLGWEYALPRLAIAAAGGDPGPDPLVSPIKGARMAARSLPARYLYRLTRRRLSRSRAVRSGEHSPTDRS
jgi:uncharacterized protein YndB with AHSA1/START domain